ncbi:6982_t:CDS:10 [Ambispora leptoticha]|uniref:6982_t:CDS:1 n=1 Tax=Ambispora leptoticha TaxID=144679 RepID=A0A9N8VLW6_9GLOM|nr:6982_t:CDS:10 [Ambispora leptoticha]
MSYTRKGIFACTPATARGQSVQLGLDPKGENFLYTNGKTVIIRSISNPAVATEYSGHVAQTTVARYAPSGYYIASGDIHGNVRVWDTTQAEQILKNEVKVIAGRINDIAWDSESKRIIAVGSGKDRYGHAFSFDTGSSVGEISGHSKVINSVDIRQHRPFRAATASDDFTVVFYHGAPYKFAKSLKDHTGFVQGVKFSPDGEKLVSVGSDKKVFLYEGKTGEKLANLSELVGDDSHKGGIYAVSWSPDSKKFLTSSADKSAKIWDVETQKIVRTFEFPDSIENQQVGNIWLGEYLVSLSLSGDLNYLDEKSSSPVKVIRGHQKAITALTRIADKTLYTGSYDEHAWTEDEANAITITGQGHTNQVIQFASNGNNVYSVGMDDTIRKVEVESKVYSTTVVPTGSLPKGIAVSKEDFIFVATVKDLQVFKDGKQITSLALSFTSGAIAVNQDGTEVAVGGEDIKVHLYQFGEEKLVEQKQLSSNRSAITALAYSPDGTLLASGDSSGKIYVYNTKTGEVKISNWGSHTARIYSIAWSPDGLHVVSGSLDTNIYVWSVEKPTKNIAIKGAHQVAVTSVIFLDDVTISSVGQDASLKFWTITHH